MKVGYFVHVADLDECIDTDMLLRGIVGSMIFELETYIDTDEIHSGMQHLG